MPDIDMSTVIFALVALFVAFKLRSVLGVRNDAGRPGGGFLAPLRRTLGPQSPAVAPPDATASGAASPAPAIDRWKGVAEPDTPAWRGLDTIAAADSSFSPQVFLSGARVAYEMVVHAFAASDSATLRGMMAPEAFANFDNAIRARTAAGQSMTTTVVSIDSASIVGAQLVGATAQLSVRFAAKLASVIRDASGEVAGGSPNAVEDHIDVWTFARDVRSRDPNWTLTATESES